ncbi:Phosphoglycolate phosphatase [compost metagenome]|jgi:haloacid dehalogenase superfamily, subfamily IA, variant 3 with third motif having DD or ED/haloacid dehalogenase superfamily, subfamily IA, variant 1 with third motif having Dx(3-4)D or Dx(3-4)E|uniref:HAD family hydrolase n=1 Tax=Sphingobacterium TaxID=28453 RepID=UPI000FA1DBAC|nr:HAD family hydrolase [Sphingobacterium sp. GVS05A]
MKLIIFDLDGTLLDTLQDLGDSCNVILQRFGYPIHQLPAYKKFVGNGVQKLIERALPEHARTTEIITTLLTAFKTYYEEQTISHTRPYSGIISLLQTLKSSGYLISVASNKYHEAVIPLMEKYFPTISFDLILGHRTGHPAKPDPEIVWDTLQTLGIAKENCYYVGDSSVDMDTANNAGVTAIGVTWGFRDENELRQHGAKHIIHVPQELLNIV